MKALGFGLYAACFFNLSPSCADIVPGYPGPQK